MSDLLIRGGSPDGGIECDILGLRIRYAGTGISAGTVGTHCHGSAPLAGLGTGGESLVLVEVVDNTEFPAYLEHHLLEVWEFGRFRGRSVIFLVIVLFLFLLFLLRRFRRFWVLVFRGLLLILIFRRFRRFRRRRRLIEASPVGETQY